MPQVEQVDRRPRYEDTDLIVNIQPTILSRLVQPNVLEVDQFKLESNRNIEEHPLFTNTQQNFEATNATEELFGALPFPDL